MPFSNLQAIADALRCSVREALSDDPVMVELRGYAQLKLLAQMRADKRIEMANGT